MFDIRRAEAAAMLCLSDEERNSLLKRAEAIMESFCSILDINTDGTEPLVSVLDFHSVLREDISQKHFARDTIMANAPEQHDGYFIVPGALE